MLRSHALRYVLKNRTTNKELLVIVFSLIPKDQVDEKGNILEKKDDSKPSDSKDSTGDDDVD